MLIGRKREIQVLTKIANSSKTVDNVSSWRLISKKSDMHGAQIDLLIDRSDDAITLVEIKYTDKVFTIDKRYAEMLQRKIDAFVTATQTQKQIFLAIISANGLKENRYSEDLIACALTLNDLF
jgi:DNA-binding sugar fermentation-stimulating protein